MKARPTVAAEAEGGDNGIGGPYIDSSVPMAPTMCICLHICTYVYLHIVLWGLKYMNGKYRQFGAEGFSLNGAGVLGGAAARVSRYVHSYITYIMAFGAPGPPKEPKTMAQYPKIEGTGSMGSIILAILEVQEDPPEHDFWNLLPTVSWSQGCTPRLTYLKGLKGRENQSQRP